MVSLFLSVGSFLEDSYCAMPAVTAALAAMLIGIGTFLACPTKPRFGKFVSLVLMILNVWLGLSTSDSYLSHESLAYRRITTSLVSRFIPY
jgi:hypothetical protein